MKNVSIVILESNEDYLHTLTDYFSNHSSYKVTGVSGDGGEGVEIILREKPDIAIVSLVLKGLDGFEVLDAIKKKNATCKVIVTGNFIDDRVINRALSKGASYYLIRPVAPETLAKRIADLTDELATPSIFTKDLHDKKKVDSLDEKISNIFISIGIPPHIKGYNYLREGIKMAVERPSIINNVTKELYPSIALRFETTSSKVERAIRHSIEVAWNRGRIEAINAVFGVRVYIGTEKPTNSEFIALIADKLILEGFL